ncbi:hypothetical protein [Halapricum desulfuricans]|uniref:Transcriptional regulator, MarR family n=1 Tax=Halapricum desulfuricans TaxID=2841257 RepID=A0A897N1D0_9EURY|nr:hypothetical protein [Halapricum desulfuricans]QSG06038.1 Transcriptional regulator, MarR family [Halapricum desulfuricans]
MDRPNCPVLAAAVKRYDATGQPVTAASIASALQQRESAVGTRLSRLVDCELLAPADGGYRPTVTGREFLDLEAECGPFIVDIDGDPRS